jgi:hypothetical protein
MKSALSLPRAPSHWTTRPSWRTCRSSRTKAVTDRPAFALRLQLKDVFADSSAHAFRDLIECKFEVDLSGDPPIVLMGGYAHPDSNQKGVTLILGLGRKRPSEGGRLRILRNPNRNDDTGEFASVFRSLLMFSVSDNAWHGLLPKKGPYLTL